MSDLISRSMYKSKLVKALDVLNKEYREALLNEDNDLILAIQNQQSAYMIALRLLDNEPTAYSVDKIVEELKAYQQQHISLCEKHDVNTVEDLYVKAIDDFVNACKDNILCQTFGLHQNGIEKIAEQLKVGK